MPQKVGLLGLGIENLALARYLMERGASITICDRRAEEEIGGRLDELGPVSRQLGPEYLAGLDRFDLVYRSPGLPLHDPALIAAEQAGVTITSAIRLFLEVCPVPVIGVTGSKGKGTTASLIFQLLQQDRQEKGGRVFLGGNIGVAPFSFLGEIGPHDLVVLEMSSFQLEDMDSSPHLAVITNITPEHLAPSDPNNPNYHHSMEEYIAAKANILAHQGPEDLVVLNADNAVCRALAEQAPGRVLLFSLREEVEGSFVADRGHGRQVYLNRSGALLPICATGDVQLRGEHNLQNICAAAAAAAAMGAEPGTIHDAVTAFQGLEHRLEFVRELDGVKYYDDSFATTPESSAVGLRAFREPVVLIAGGADKGSDYRPYAEAIVEGDVRVVILLGVTAGKIRAAIEAVAGERGRSLPRFIEGLTAMPEIVAAARAAAEPGAVILLSTACASFGLFRNYKERGDLFKGAVWAL